MYILSMALLTLWTLPAAGQPVVFRHHVVDDEGPVDVWLKATGDVNGDGKLDLIAGCRTAGGLVWYENPGWKKHRVAAGLFGTDGEVADIDGDGDADLVAITEQPQALAWWENPGWAMHPIAYERLHDVEVADLDADGDLDLVARNQGAFGATGNTLYFYRQEPCNRWTVGKLSISDGEGLALADLDRDGDADAVVERVWYENNGDALGRNWPGHTYADKWSHPFTFVAAGRINSDPRTDIVLAPSEREKGTYRISWFEAPADPKSSPWQEHIVESPAETVHHFSGVGDFDGNGQGDIAAAEMQQGADPDEVKIYLNPGMPNASNKMVLSIGGSHSMRIADIDGDGDVDLYGANWRGRMVGWWENLR